MLRLTIKPFRGYRYNLACSNELGRYTSPPYDMLDNKTITELLQRDPRNVVRIIQNPREHTDTENAARHRRAASLFNHWIASNIIGRDPEPSFYVYRQKFVSPLDSTSSQKERLGLICLLKTVDFKYKLVIPHENTLSAPKADRLEHRIALKADTELIFGIISDNGPIYKLIQKASEGMLCGEFVDSMGVEHYLIRNCEKALIESLQEACAETTVLIADGHHRYETACAYAQHSADPRNAFVMIALVSMVDPGLVILPFHRLIRKGFGSIDGSVRERLERYFELEKLPCTLQTVYSFLSGGIDARMLFLNSEDSTLYKLQLLDSSIPQNLSAYEGMSEQWNNLDVSIINSIFIGSILGLKPDATILHDAIEYINNPSTAFSKAIGKDEYHGVFFLRPVNISTIRSIVEKEERMPQKSTNFFPKYYSGLVFNRLEDE